ncbi:metallophosphoesterase family protein [Falsiroseomonas sp. CW058]|uniref:metallophosphoesterase family protein n=1 Tax=Falsiroseomonas sp. CW058 TaxID=3388664 RepID=UPI003D323CE7
MTVFFTSDTHFGHAGARGLYRRPFATVAEMDAAMEARWNAVVGPRDEVWHLGDVAVGVKPAALAELLGRLNGRKHLVAGNNDPPATTTLAAWASVQPYAEIEVEGRHLVLCHYAFRSWRNMHRGWLDLHGHSHGRLAPLPRQADVGVDARDFRPVTLGELFPPGRRGALAARGAAR